MLAVHFSAHLAGAFVKSYNYFYLFNAQFFVSFFACLLCHFGTLRKHKTLCSVKFSACFLCYCLGYFAWCRTSYNALRKRSFKAVFQLFLILPYAVGKGLAVIPPRFRYCLHYSSAVEYGKGCAFPHHLLNVEYVAVIVFLEYFSEGFV